jgi:hypothetical protein
MKSKLHFGILIMLMAFLGRYIKTSVIPNQQIVIEFLDNNISEDDTQNTIETIQIKLNRIGVEDIIIGQNQNGHLKITYYSNTNIQHIEDLLSNDESFKISHKSGEENSNSLPEQGDLKHYKLNISEIQKGSTNDWDFEDFKIVEFNHKSDRSSNLKINTSGISVKSESCNIINKLSLELSNNAGLAVIKLSYKIPEIRAGPNS